MGLCPDKFIPFPFFNIDEESIWNRMKKRRRRKGKRMMFCRRKGKK